MKKNARLLFSVLALLSAAVGAPCPAAADAGARAGVAGARALAVEHPLVTFEPLVKYAAPGALCTLQVMVDGAVDSLGCMGVYLALGDTAVAEVTGAYKGRIFDSAAPGHPSVFFHWEKTAPDSVNAEACVLGYRTYVLAPGELARFVLRAKALGVCTVSFTEVRLWDIDRVELEPIAGDAAQITVRYPTGHDEPAPALGSLSNHPNPFNPGTILSFELPGDRGAAAPVDGRVDIYDVSGALVRSLFRGRIFPGRREMIWDGRNEMGRLSAAGVYIVSVETAGGVLTRKVVLIR